MSRTPAPWAWPEEWHAWTDAAQAVQRLMSEFHKHGVVATAGKRELYEAICDQLRFLEKDQNQ